MKHKNKQDLCDFFADTDMEDRIKRERAKARELRRSQWWRNKLNQGVCYYCGQKFPPGELTMDHLVSLALGGLSTKNNLVTACKNCNNKKKQNLPQTWENLTPPDNNEPQDEK